MSFVSPEFAFLCVLFLPLYWALANQALWQQRLLTVSGYALYATWSLNFAVVLLVYSVVIWLFGRWISTEKITPNIAIKTRLAMTIGVVLCAGFLIVVKYYEFVRQLLLPVLAAMGLGSLMPIIDVVDRKSVV